MSISSIASSAYTTQIMSYQKGTCAVKQTTATSNNTTSTGDSVTISEEAHQKRFTDTALNLLIRRDLSNEDIERFGNIIQEADSAESAKDFLKNLSPEDIDLVKRANKYAPTLNDSHIDTMSEEGARNMLVQPDNRAFVDLNDDGIVDHGVARTFVFPPPNAPESVKDAWDETLEALPKNERLLASTIFLTQQMSANLKVDDTGKVIGFYQAGEEGFKNIFSQQEDDWFGLFDDCDEYFDFSEKYAQDSSHSRQIQKNRAIVELFRSNLAGESTQATS